MKYNKVKRAHRRVRTNTVAEGRLTAKTGVNDAIRDAAVTPHSDAVAQRGLVHSPTHEIFQEDFQPAGITRLTCKAGCLIWCAEKGPGVQDVWEQLMQGRLQGWPPSPSLPDSFLFHCLRSVDPFVFITSPCENYLVLPLLVGRPPPLTFTS